MTVVTAVERTAVCCHLACWEIRSSARTDFINKRLQSVTTKRSIMVLTGLQITTKYRLRIWICGGKNRFLTTMFKNAGISWLVRAENWASRTNKERHHTASGWTITWDTSQGIRLFFCRCWQGQKCCWWCWNRYKSMQCHQDFKWQSKEHCKYSH